MTRRENADKLAQAQEERDWKWLMSTKPGRRIVWRLLAECHMFQTTFSPDSATMAFNEGERYAGLRIQGRIDQFCPEQYEAMRRENIEHYDDTNERGTEE